MNSHFGWSAAMLGLLAAKLCAATTVTFHAGPGTPFVATQDGSPAADGEVVLLGAFTQGFDPAANAASLGALRSAWLEYGRTSTRAIFGEPGRFAQTASQANAAFDHRPAHLLILSTRGQPLAADWSNVSEYGLFTGPWVFPSQQDLPPDNTASFSADDAAPALFGSVTSQALRLQSAGLSLAAWRAQAFPVGTPAAQTADEADPDGDRMSNLAEYALGSDPLAPGVPEIGVRQSEANLVLEYPARTDRPDVILRWRRSQDLVNWTPLELSDALAAQDGPVQRRRLEVPPESTRGFFARFAEPAKAP
jgi:hypothetical protein